MENYANLVAMQVIHTAQRCGYLDGPINALEALSDLERDLFIAVLRQIRIHLNREDRTELSGEEMISLYTFVLAKAAEATSSILGKKPFEMELTGMLDGKIPFYTEPRLESFCHSTAFPADFARDFQQFCSHYGEALSREGVEPMLVLVENLKWVWRIAVHVCYDILTGKNRNS